MSSSVGASREPAGTSKHPPARGDLEDVELSLLLEGVFRHYGFDFRQYAPASLRRRVWRRVHRGRPPDDLCPAGEAPPRPRLHGALPPRPVDQRHVDVPRSRRSTSRSGRRSCRFSGPTRSPASGSPGARRVRRSTPWRSCCRRRVCTSGRGSTRPTSTSRCSIERDRACSRSTRCASTRRTTSRPAGHTRSPSTTSPSTTAHNSSAR